jgi:hypothetical protein
MFQVLINGKLQMQNSKLSLKFSMEQSVVVTGVVVLIRCIAKELTCLYVRGDSCVVEVQVRASRVPKLIKLGDRIEVVGGSLEEATCCVRTVPRVLVKYDPQVSGQFTPDAGAKAVSHQKLASGIQHAEQSCCRFWLSDKKCERWKANICRFSHPPLGSEQFLKAQSERLAALNLARSLKVECFNESNVN